MSRHHRPLLAILALTCSSLAAGLLPSTALAGDAVVSPLVSKGVDPLVVLNMTSLIASELDFMGKYDNVDQLQEMPAGMNGACLASPSCLGQVAKANKTGAVVAGAVALTGNKFDLFLVLYDGGRIVRSKDFTIVNVPSVIADSMGGYVKELVTGQSAGKAATENSDVEAAAEMTSADMFEDDFEFEDKPSSGNSRRIPVPAGRTGGDDELGDFDMMEDESTSRAAEAAKAKAAEEAKAKAAAEERRRAEEEARRQAEEEARRQAEEEAHRQAEEDARRRKAEAAAEERRRADEEESRRRSAAASSSSDDEDFEDLQFGKAADQIEIEEIQFKSAPAAIVVEDDDSDDDYVAFSAPSRSSSSDSSSRSSSSRYSSDDDSSSRSSRSSDDDERSSRSSRSSDDDERSSRSSSRSSRYSDLDDEDDGSSRKTKRTTSSSDAEASSSLAARLGYSKFQDLGFVTYGAEATFMPTPFLALVGGIEAYSTRRQIPPALTQDATVPVYEWNTILPMNVGLMYKMTSHSVRPYVGADLQIIPGYVKDSGGMAVGVRARGGADFMVADNFGFNLNVGAGFWSGKNFETVQKEFNSSALVPSISGGTVIAF